MAAVEEIEKKLEKKFSLNRPKLGYAMLKGKKFQEQKDFSCTIPVLPCVMGRGPSLPPELEKLCKKIDFGIEMKTISRNHALLKWENDGFVLECLSRNGIVVNGRGIKQNESINLPANQATPIRIGALFVYFLPAQLPDLPVKHPIDLILDDAFERNPSMHLTVVEIVEKVCQKYDRTYIDSFGGPLNITSFVKHCFKLQHPALEALPGEKYRYKMS